ncbi:MAG: BON domain-containing protein [Candidatus Acidiferrales bacterium]
MLSRPKALVCSLLTTALALVSLGIGTAVAGGPAKAQPPNPDAGTVLANQVRHKLVMLPWLTVFDNLEYQVDGSEVMLTGQVTQPVLKDEAVDSVKRIAGVTQVVDQIEVLPLSPFDSSIRRAEYRAIYGYSSLSRYGLGTLPSIHIIVDNGNVTLEGIVDTKTDSDIANVLANEVPGVFSVTNNLRYTR